MSRKHFSGLLIATALVALLLLLIPDRAGRKSGFEPLPLLPGLAEQINDIGWLRLTGPGGEVIATLERGDTRWQLREAGGYPADWERLRSLLVALSEAEIIEPKTANSAYYDRLGVQDVEREDAAGVRVEFAAETGLPAVIVGNSAQGRDGSYVREQGAAASFLVDRRLELPREREAWMERTVVDIADGEVVEVGIVHPDGEVVAARKVSADDEDFELQGIPGGREIRSKWTVNSLAGSLSSLTLDEVMHADQFDWSDATRFRLLTADGLEVEVELQRIGAPAPAPGQAAAAEQDAVREGGEEYWLRIDARASEEAAAERAAAINERTAGWAYRVAKFKYESMTRRMDDLLQATGSS